MVAVLFGSLLWRFELGVDGASEVSLKGLLPEQLLARPGDTALCSPRCRCARSHRSAFSRMALGEYAGCMLGCGHVGSPYLRSFIRSFIVWAWCCRLLLLWLCSLPRLSLLSRLLLRDGDRLARRWRLSRCFGAVSLLRLREFPVDLLRLRRRLCLLGEVLRLSLLAHPGRSGDPDPRLHSLRGLRFRRFGGEC